MARLFVTSREIQFINDINKEFIKDIVGQTIVYYPVSILKTKVHPVYNEAVRKIFDNPIKIPCLANTPDVGVNIDRWSIDRTSNIEVYVQARDLIDKGFTLYEGDFFTFGNQAYEVSSFLNIGNIYGQEEYEIGYKITGTPARVGQFDPKNFLGPTNDSNNDYLENKVEHNFEQQRGFTETSQGVTGDIRQLRDRLGEDMAPIALGDGPRVVKVDSNKKASSFYNEDE